MVLDMEKPKNKKGTCGRARWQGAEATRKYFNIVLTRQEILYLRALQGHSGRNLIDPSLS